MTTPFQTQDAADESEILEPRPRDEIEREVAQWASQNRSAFTNRRDYNLAVCDRLASHGIAPLTGVLRRLGGRGTSTSQDEDVRAWYATIATRLGNLEAKIPLGARRQANGLIEQLWTAATREVEERHAAPLRNELASAQEAVATGLARIQELEASLQVERERSSTLSRELEAAANRYRDDTERFQQQVDTARQELATDRERHQRETDTLRSDAAQAANAHAEEIRQLRARHDQAELAAADERNRLMRQVDEERKAARGWQARHDEVAKRRDSLQERLEAALASEARARAEQTTAAAAADKLQAQLQDAHRELKAAQEAMAAAGAAQAAANERALQLQERVVAAEKRISELQGELATARASAPGRC